jgi:serine/threonine protein kinase
VTLGLRCQLFRYVEGGSLANASRSFGKFSEHLVACYAAKMLEGLHYLHGEDVSPLVHDNSSLIACSTPL